MGGATMFLRIVSIGATVILARILDPGDFGVLAMAGIVLSTTSLFSGLGMNMAVIQRQEDRHELAYQGFVVTLISGVVLQLVVLIGAPWFAPLLGSNDVVPVLRWMSFLVLLGSLVSVPEGLLQKDLLFGRQSAAMIAAELMNLGLSVTLRVYGLRALGPGFWPSGKGPPVPYSRLATLPRMGLAHPEEMERQTHAGHAFLRVTDDGRRVSFLLLLDRGQPDCR